jgi:class 3 adenylate cyclase
MALAVREEAARHLGPDGQPLAVRIGIDTGPVVAGVIGRRKFSYDLWGDTVNTASRMESHGVPGCIQVTDRIYRRLRDSYRFERRGSIPVKNMGEIVTYFLLGRNE